MTKQVQVWSRRGRSSGEARISLLPFFAPFDLSVLEPSLDEKIKCHFLYSDKWLASGNSCMLSLNCLKLKNKKDITLFKGTQPTGVHAP